MAFLYQRSIKHECQHKSSRIDNTTEKYWLVTCVFPTVKQNISWCTVRFGYLDNFCQIKASSYDFPQTFYLREKVHCVSGQRPVRIWKMQSRVWSSVLLGQLCSGKQTNKQKNPQYSMWCYLPKCLCVSMLGGRHCVSVFILQPLVLRWSQSTWWSWDEQGLQLHKGHCFNHSFL